MTSEDSTAPRLNELTTNATSNLELMKQLSATAKGAGKAISEAFSKGVVEGKSFEQVLRNMGKALAEFSLKAAFKPLELSLSKLFEQVFQKAQGPIGQVFDGLSAPASAGAPLSIAPTAFADGGVVTAPSWFPLGRGAGLMGEAGPEAILPLARGADGRLGVAATGGGASITVNVQASDVESFRRSEAQIAATLARAVARGGRAL